MKASSRPWPQRLALFARSPKGILLWTLLVLAATAAPAEGIARAGPTLAIAIGVAAAADTLVTSVERGRLAFPASALLTGLFVGLLMSPVEPAYNVAMASTLAVCSKHALRTRRWNVFNPAALGLLLTALLFASGESWWGALPDVPAVFLAVLGLGVIVVVEKVNKWPQTLAFLATLALLFTIASFVDSSPLVTEAFRAPYLNAALFFAAFMLSDPPTSPTPYREQVAYGAGVAAISFAIQMAFHPQYYLLAGLVLGNGLFAWYRTRSASSHRPLARPPLAAPR